MGITSSEFEELIDGSKDVKEVSLYKTTEYATVHKLPEFYESLKRMEYRDVGSSLILEGIPKTRINQLILQISEKIGLKPALPFKNRIQIKREEWRKRDPNIANEDLILVDFFSEDDMERFMAAFNAYPQPFFLRDLAIFKDWLGYDCIGVQKEMYKQTYLLFEECKMLKTRGIIADCFLKKCKIYIKFAEYDEEIHVFTSHQLQSLVAQCQQTAECATDFPLIAQHGISIDDFPMCQN